MPTLTFVHEFECSAEEFWSLFFDPEFNSRVFKEELKFPEYSATQTDGPQGLTRTVKATPKMDLPGPLAKLFGGSFRYTEEGSFDKATQTWKWKTVPAMMADKIRNEGSMRVESIAPGKIKRTAEIFLEAKIFGLGGMLESSGEKTLRDAWENYTAVMKRHLASKK